MDQYLQHTIQELKGSSEKADQAQGVVLEILLSQNKKLESIEVQTKLTNGRVTCLENKIKPLEEHHLKRKWLQSTLAGAAGALIAGVTLIAGFISLGDMVLAKSPAPEVSEKVNALKGR